MVPAEEESASDAVDSSVLPLSPSAGVQRSPNAHSELSAPTVRSRSEAKRNSESSTNKRPSTNVRNRARVKQASKQLRQQERNTARQLAYADKKFGRAVPLQELGEEDDRPSALSLPDDLSNDDSDSSEEELIQYIDYTSSQSAEQGASAAVVNQQTPAVEEDLSGKNTEALIGIQTLEVAKKISEPSRVDPAERSPKVTSNKNTSDQTNTPQLKAEEALSERTPISAPTDSIFDFGQRSSGFTQPAKPKSVSRVLAQHRHDRVETSAYRFTRSAASQSRLKPVVQNRHDRVGANSPHRQIHSALSSKVSQPSAQDASRPEKRQKTAQTHQARQTSSDKIPRAPTLTGAHHFDHQAAAKHRKESKADQLLLKLRTNADAAYKALLSHKKGIVSFTKSTHEFLQSFVIKSVTEQDSKCIPVPGGGVLGQGSMYDALPCTLSNKRKRASPNKISKASAPDIINKVPTIAPTKASFWEKVSATPVPKRSASDIVRKISPVAATKVEVWRPPQPPINQEVLSRFRFGGFVGLLSRTKLTETEMWDLWENGCDLASVPINGQTLRRGQELLQDDVLREKLPRLYEQIQVWFSGALHAFELERFVESFRGTQVMAEEIQYLYDVKCGTKVLEIDFHPAHLTRAQELVEDEVLQIQHPALWTWIREYLAAYGCPMVIDEEGTIPLTIPFVANVTWGPLFNQQPQASVAVQRTSPLSWPSAPLQRPPPFQQPLRHFSPTPYAGQTLPQSHSTALIQQSLPSFQPTQLPASNTGSTNPGPPAQNKLPSRLTPHEAYQGIHALLFSSTSTIGITVREQELVDKWGKKPYEEIAGIIREIVKRLRDVERNEVIAQSGLLDRWLEEEDPLDRPRPRSVFWKEQMRVFGLKGAEARYERQQARQAYEGMMQARNANTEMEV